MLLLYYMILSVLEPSIFFSMLHDCVTVTMADITSLLYFMTYITITHNITLYLLFKSKIKKS